MIIPVSAEVDPAVLNEILSQLSQDDTSTWQTPPIIPLTDHIEVSLNPTWEIWKPLNLRLQAKTANGDISSSYRWTIFIRVLNAPDVTISHKDGYTFTENDKWTKTFINGISFPNEWVFRVNVSDVSQSSISGATFITIISPTIIPIVTNTWTIPEYSDIQPEVINNEPVVNSAPIDPEISTIKDPKFTITNIATSENRITISFKVEDEPSTLQKFAITYIDTTGKSNTVTTYDKNQIKKKNGSYEWYIPELPAKKYTISIVGIDASGEKISSVASETFEADLSPKTIEKCIISDISGIKTTKKNNTIVLSWNGAPGAIWYKIFKKDASGEYIFIQETKNNSYTIYTTNTNIANYVFDVKGICVNKAESIKSIPNTRIKTGPSTIIILLLSMFISSLWIRKRWLLKRE